MNTGLPKDHTGTKFGRLTAIKRLKSNKVDRLYTTYLCSCECGKELEVRGCQLVTGNTKSCGCLNKEKIRETRAINYTGQRFNRLIAVERIKLPQRGVLYRCLCDCGKEVTVSTGHLQCGNTKSCGCLNREKIMERNHDPELILKRMKSSNGCYMVKHWESKKKLLCKGKWERNVARWLNKRKINYEWQVPFKLPDGRTYIIDFYDKDSNVYVEIKGWWRDDAKEKFDLFKTSNPALNVEVWTTEELKSRKISTH